MKKYVYPVILFEDAEKKYYTVLFPDLDIVASGETVEDAFLEAEDFLQSFLEFAEKMNSKIASPTPYVETEKMNPKRIVLLADAQTSGDYSLTQEEEQYKNFISKYVVSETEG